MVRVGPPACPATDQRIGSISRGMPPTVNCVFPLVRGGASYTPVQGADAILPPEKWLDTEAHDQSCGASRGPADARRTKGATQWE
ncbi:hypothetical protein GCM10023086_67930 [Streptomyces venetus]|uniref:Uncharacterized protein n=1 Tax=Streptomyces venetus TaxID=1701086 RepID=A0ABP8H7H3_9ACTN